MEPHARDSWQWRLTGIRVRQKGRSQMQELDEAVWQTMKRTCQILSSKDFWGFWCEILFVLWFVLSGVFAGFFGLFFKLRRKSSSICSGKCQLFDNRRFSTVRRGLNSTICMMVSSHGDTSNTFHKQFYKYQFPIFIISIYSFASEQMKEFTCKIARIWWKCRLPFWQRNTQQNWYSFPQQLFPWMHMFTY